MSEKTPDEELVLLEVRMRLAIRVYDFKLQERIVLDFLVDRTYARRKDRALIPTLDYVVKICRMLRSDAGAVLRRLEEEYFVIGSGPAPEFRSRAFQDPRWMWFLPHPQNWKGVIPRVDREAAAQMHRDLDYMEECQGRLTPPDGTEFDPASMPGLKAEIAASSRTDALHDERQRLEQTRQAATTRPGLVPSCATDGPDVCGNSAHVGVRKFRTHTEIPYTSATCAEIPYTSHDYTSRARPPAREHVHVHGTPAVPQHMNHGHVRSVAGEDESLRDVSTAALFERLDEESVYALSILEEIVGAATARSYHRTWLLRLNDRWKGCALDAIGEVKRRHVQGEGCRVGWGETANDLFHRYKKAPDEGNKSGKPAQ